MYMLKVVEECKTNNGSCFTCKYAGGSCEHTKKVLKVSKPLEYKYHLSNNKGGK